MGRLFARFPPPSFFFIFIVADILLNLVAIATKYKKKEKTGQEKEGKKKEMENPREKERKRKEKGKRKRPQSAQRAGLQEAKAVFIKIENTLFLHFGKLTGEGGAVDRQIACQGGAVKGNMEGTGAVLLLALGKEGQKAKPQRGLG